MEVVESTGTCSKCLQIVPLKDFAYRDKKTRRCSFCKACEAGRSRVWYANNIDRRAAYEKERNVYRRDKPCWRMATFELYDQLFELQGGKCGICASTSPNKRGLKFFPMDHNHETGEIRGLLCNPCNMRLGIVKEDTSRWPEARPYLQSPPMEALSNGRSLGWNPSVPERDLQVRSLSPPPTVRGVHDVMHKPVHNRVQRQENAA